MDSRLNVSFVQPAERMAGLPEQFFASWWEKRTPESRKAKMSSIWVKAIPTALRPPISWRSCRRLRPTPCTINIRRSADILF
ncbi:hypothetical protein D3C71_2030820 [compost metagenome]